MGFARLCVLSLTMFLSTLAIGNLPLSLSSVFSPRSIRQISLYGAGLLVGASLTIIIPEGIDAVYKSRGYPAAREGEGGDDSHGKAGLVGLALISGFLLMFLIDQLQAGHHSHTPMPVRRRRLSGDSPVSQPLLTCAPSFTLHGSSASSASSHKTTSRPHSIDLESGDAHGPLTEEFFASSHYNGGGPPPAKPRSESAAGKAVHHYPGEGGHSNRSLSTTIGLIAHSLADGISLGASSALVPTSGDGAETGSLDLIVFVAIMVHKAPAAFGMVAVLLSEGLSRSTIRRSLLGFSAAAPVGALAAWGLLQLIVRAGGGTGGGHRDSVGWWTGMALLFSGGTFLYVATHVMGDIESQTDDAPPSSSSAPPPLPLASASSYSSIAAASPACGPGPDRDGGSGEVGRGLKTVLMVAGMLSPMVLTKLVGHGH